MDDLTDRSFEELFGEVRSIVHGAPSAQAFARLTEVLDAMGREGAGRIEPGYLTPVKRWDPVIRLLPKRWAERVLDGEDLPHLDVCGHIRIDTAREAALLGGDHARGVRALTVSCREYPMSELTDRLRGVLPMQLEHVEWLRMLVPEVPVGEAIRASPCFEGLREFRVECEYPASRDYYTDIYVWESMVRWACEKESLARLTIEGRCMPDQLTEALQDAKANLEELHVEIWEQDLLRGAHLELLLAADALSRLKALTLNYPNKRFTERLDDDGVEHLLDAPCAPTLERVSLSGHNLTEVGVAKLQRLPRLSNLDVSNNDFDPTRIEETPHSTTLVTEGCIPERERSVYVDPNEGSHLEHLRSWMRHLNFDGLYLYAFIMMLVAGFHASLISNTADHPLQWWFPFVMRAPLAIVHAVSHYHSTRIGQWTSADAVIWLDRGEFPEHEIRALRWRPIRSALIIVGLDLALFTLAALSCVWGPFATPETAWEEVLLWSFGPCAMFTFFAVPAGFAISYESIRGR